MEVDRMRNGFNSDTLTFVEICEIVKMGGNVIKNYDGVIYRENSKTSPFRKTSDKFFTLGQKYKDEGNHLMQGLVFLIMTCLFGVQVRNETSEFYKSKSEQWMQRE